MRSLFFFRFSFLPLLPPQELIWQSLRCAWRELPKYRHVGRWKWKSHGRTPACIPVGPGAGSPGDPRTPPLLGLLINYTRSEDRSKGSAYLLARLSVVSLVVAHRKYPAQCSRNSLPTLRPTCDAWQCPTARLSCEAESSCQRPRFTHSPKLLWLKQAFAFALASRISLAMDSHASKIAQEQI